MYGQVSTEYYIIDVYRYKQFAILYIMFCTQFWFVNCHKFILNVKNLTVPYSTLLTKTNIKKARLKTVDYHINFKNQFYSIIYMLQAQLHYNQFNLELLFQKYHESLQFR